LTSVNRIRTSNRTYRVRISKKKNLSFSKEMFFNFFNFMKWRRLRASSLFASSVLMSTLSLFRYCLFSFSSSPFSISWSFSSSFSVSFSVSSSVWGWIDSMNSERCLWIHLIWQSCLHLNAFELRELSQRWIFKRLFFRSWNFHLSMILHLQISLKILHVLRQSSSIFRSRRTTAWSYHLWFSYTKKRINDFDLKISFESTISQQSVSINSQSTVILSSMWMNVFDQQTFFFVHAILEFCESKAVRW
jgi:hypothetical protein